MVIGHRRAPVRRVRSANPVLRVAAGAISGCLITASTAVASAHAGAPAVAFLNEPDGVGIVVDETFAFTWRDADVPIPTGTATVDFFYTQNRPATFAAGDIPNDLQGQPIVQGIWERDLTNRYVWDVDDVPAGSYHIWSRVTEPPEEVDSLQIIHFAPGVVTVARAGEPVHPALFARTPATPSDFADLEYEVRYSAFDPDGTGRVRIDAAQLQSDDRPGSYRTIARDLPAVPDGRWIWPTKDFSEGDWLLRMTITDDRGLSFTTFGEFFVFIVHLSPVVDAGTADAAAPSSPPSSDGCRCLNADDQTALTHGAFGLFIGLWGLLRRGQPGACRHRFTRA